MKELHQQTNGLEGLASNGRCSRRSLLTLAGSLAATALLPACRRPVEKIVPAVTRPELLVPGKPLHYATALSFMGTAFGLLVETHEGRPTKVEGNPRHPESLGATSSFLQASIMQLYDADRSRGPTEHGQARDWQAASGMLDALGKTLKPDQGRSFALLANDHRSPTLAAAIAELATALPEARVFGFEPFDRSEAHAGCKIAFDRAVEPIYDFSKADMVLALDADPLGMEGSPLRAARAWSVRRAPEHGPMNRWYVVESSLTATGTVADHRFRCESSRVPGVLCALAAQLHERNLIVLDDALARLVVSTSKTIDLGFWQPRLRSLADDLGAHRGRSIILAGMRQPKAVHGLVHLLNEALGNKGSTVKYVRCFDEYPSGMQALQDLAQSIRVGTTKHLLILGCSPAYDAPSELDFVQAIAQTETSIHLGMYRDETAKACNWHINQAHPFESWSDVVSEDGTASIVQPLIAPLFDGHSDIEVVRSLLGQTQSAYDAVRSYWQSQLGKANFERSWRKALHDGIVDATAFPAEEVSPETSRIAEALAALPLPVQTGYELTFVPDAHVFDGRFANNAWLHELPESVTKVTWGNVARISTAIASKYELSDGDLISLGVQGRKVQVAVVVTPGQADNTISLSLGQGRTAGGVNAIGTGINMHPLRLASSPYLSRCDSFERRPSHVQLARTQEQFGMLGRAPVKIGTSRQFEAAPEAVPGKVRAQDEVQRPVRPAKVAHAFAMNIDLSKCIGCNACAVACQAENNVSVVGADGVRRGRHMHWLRIDRYYEGSGDHLQAYSQPIVCQQCEKAPCETVCPAGATSHSPDGLNDMVYNRCVGSRYCENNCPFKVRKFNYFEYWGSVEPLRRMQLNPDVTVRSRGVMEKCTFCVQRINAAKISGKRRGTLQIADGSIVTACEQACPTGAIVFGDLLDQTSRVAEGRAGPRTYRLLDELNLEPRVFYQSKIRNPNPELDS